MAIQMRQGNEVDFDAEKMLPGEWAVSKDARIVRMCFSPGVVIRMATYEAFEADMGEIRDILSEAKTVQEAVQIIQSEINNSEIVVEQYSTMSKSYAVGGTGSREEEDTDNAKYYYDQAKRIAQGVNGIVPMGTITFEELPTGDVVNNAMYNISNAFTSDERFNDGGGVYYGAGNNVVWTASGKWDVTAASGVTGIKGENEIDYRQGNVNITRDNIGLGDDVFGTADISSIGDGTVKGAIKDIEYKTLRYTFVENGDVYSLDSGDYYLFPTCANLPEEDVHFVAQIRVSEGGIKTFMLLPSYMDRKYFYLQKEVAGTLSGWEKHETTDNFLPLTGGTLSGGLYITKNGGIFADSGEIAIAAYSNENSEQRRALSLKNPNTEIAYALLVYDAIIQKNYIIFGEHNKPSGFYTGNGDATFRSINTGGIGSLCVVHGNNYCSIIGDYGGIWWNTSGQTGVFSTSATRFKDGNLYLTTASQELNGNGGSYYYQIL